MSISGPGFPQPAPGQPGVPPAAVPQADPVQAGEEALAMGRYQHSATIAAQAMRSRPNDPDLRRILGASLTRLGQPDRGVEHLQAAVKAKPRVPINLVDLGECLRFLERPDDARASFEKALSIRPGFLPAEFQLILLDMYSGETEAALGRARPLATGEEPNPNLVILAANLCQQTGAHEEGLGLLAPLLESSDLAPPLRREALFAQGKLHDSLGAYDDAFGAISQANAIGSNPQTADADAIIGAWGEGVLWTIEPSPDRNETPVFIVGMPRTGSTLLEQILVAGSAVESVGEGRALPLLARTLPPNAITPEKTQQAGAAYLASLQARVGPGITRVLDKQPGSIFHLGLVSRILPGARVIETVRDPRDVCLSCYFQNFGPHIAFATDMIAIARQLHACQRVMDHWRQATDLRIHTQRFEDLVADPGPQIDGAHRFLGIEPDPACLRFHESKRLVNTASTAQVRRPINTAGVARWKNYETHLAPAIDELSRLGVALD